MKDAFVVTNRLGVSSKSRERDRRPTLDELDKLMEHFGARLKRRPSSVPMQQIIAFAIFSTRRQEEITRIGWVNLDTEGSRVLVRDMKNPGEKIGNDTWCDLPPEALQIILSMPRTSDEIFPYSTDAIGAAFTRAVQFLEIDDLHFHDLRHDGVSRLFEHTTRGVGVRSSLVDQPQALHAPSPDRRQIRELEVASARDVKLSGRS
jgi:integrase